MKNNSTTILKTQIPRINFPESLHSNYQQTKSKTIESSFKTSKSLQDVFNKKYDTAINLINRQSSNMQLSKPQLQHIPPPIKPKQLLLKKQSLFSFDIISQYAKSFREENAELKEHVKFLLKQIKKLKQLRSIDVNGCSYNELFSKLTQELEKIKFQLKEKEQILIELRRSHEHSSKENKAMKNSSFHKKEFDLNSLLPECKEQIEFDSIKKSMVLNDLTSTTFSLNAVDHNSNNNITSIFSLTPNMHNACITPYYVKKVGLGCHKKKESGNTLTSVSLTVQPIVEKKVIMTKSFNCLYDIMDKGKLVVFHMSDMRFTSIDFIDTCSFNDNLTDKKDAITLNASSGLYILSGEDCNQLYHFDSTNSTMKQLDASLYSHCKGAMLLYTNYLSEEKLICLCSNTHIKVEMYNADNGKWSELPKMNNHNDLLSRIDTGYLLLNNHFVVAFYGYDYIRNQYVDTIDFLSLTNPTQWDEISLSQTITSGLLLRSHAVFKLKNELNTEKQSIYLLGGYNNEGQNIFLIEINIKSDLSECTPIIKDTSFDPNGSNYSFSSSLYEYTHTSQQSPLKKAVKYAFDCNKNIHMIETESLKHDIHRYSFQENWLDES